MKRIITGILLIAIIAPCVILGDWFIVGLSALILGCSIFELLKTGKGQHWSIAVYIVTVFFSILLFAWSFYISYYNGKDAIFSIPNPFIATDNIFLVCAFLIAILTVECLSENFNVNVAFYLFTMTIMISVACAGIIQIRQQLGAFGLLYLIICSWGCDFGGHIFGSLFGKTPLASVSPKKTLEGAIGGIAIATAGGTLVYYIAKLCGQPFFAFRMSDFVIILISAILGLGAVVGDLIFSSIKRQTKIKDFSEVLPGHGGVLDRFDSIIFNTLIYLCIYSIIIEGLTRL